jgi:hypothetical protein
MQLVIDSGFVKSYDTGKMVRLIHFQVGRVTGFREMSGAVQADAKFLRRVLLGLIALTLLAGAMIGFTTAQAMSEAEAPALVSSSK